MSRQEIHCPLLDQEGRVAHFIESKMNWIPWYYIDI
jgi:hypothetical protein